MRQVGIIGLGWLGKHVYNSLKKMDIDFFGTVSSEEKAIQCREENLHVVKYVLGDPLTVFDEFRKVDYFLITIPPSSSDKYIEQICKVITHIKTSNPNSRLIYTSSTSVYGNLPQIVTESTEVTPQTENAVKITGVESFLMQFYKNDTYILRLSGLVGGDRHPVKYMSGRHNLSKPYTQINLVHRDDIVAFLKFILTDQVTPGTFNLSSPEHPEKHMYYEWAAEKLTIEKPYFNFGDKTLDKTVFCEAIENTGFQFLYQSPYDFPL